MMMKGQSLLFKAPIPDSEFPFPNSSAFWYNVRIVHLMLWGGGFAALRLKSER